ncbi:Zinc finger protein 142 [Larimichthys crocea]|uniref:Uncharacterized protein n=1 Tax=Larimichthys crocea TaxID=215358 RepID=A0ACD3QG81_LARCR|nr:Zinc finger protein 142 [Larimichthys crocea]
MADADCEQSDLDDNYEPLTNTSQPFEAEECQTQASEGKNDGGTTDATFPSGQNQPLESELRLKAMKKHDKDQAEAMVLEGRVQMLVVPTKEIYRCDKCCYVTSKETALKYHCQTLCHGRIKEYKCHACGGQFKQKRGLDSHLAKKCPALPRKTRIFVGISNPCLATEASTVGQEGSTLLDEGTHSDQTELLSSHKRICTDLNDQEFHQQEVEVCTSQLTNCKHVDPNAVTSSESEHELNKIQTKNLLKGKSSKKELLSNNNQRKVPLQSLYTKKDGKFKCKCCNFLSVKLATVERHLSTCRKRDNQIISEENDASGNKSVKEKEGLVEEHNERSGKASDKPQLFSCPGCSFKCNQKRALDSHEKRGCSKPAPQGAIAWKSMSLYTQESVVTAAICAEKTFGAVTKLRQHKIRIHDKQPTHFCSLCDFSGYTLDDVRRHNLRCHTGVLHHACTHCDAQFSSEVALRNHCKRVHQLQACFSCKQCDYTCSNEVTLKTHQESKHPQVKCTTCQESFKTKESLAIHQRTHLAHQCQLCSFATKTRQLLAQHLLNEHEEGSTEDKPLKCSTCQFACRHQLVLEQHLRSHGGKRLYKCTDCKYSTRNKQKITWHIRIHTGEKPYSCEQCSYTCTDPSRLKLHMRVHQDEKKYLCPQCGYKCKWATQLKYHMTKHTGDKPYACDECDYRTNRADALRAHRDTQHCDMRPYVCEKCGKAFKTSFILKTHQRQHSDDRPYTCGLCQKAFRWPAGLRHHYLSHTKQQPFCCRHCSYRAKQKFQVVKHLQRHHPDMSMEQGVVRDSEAVSLTLKEALEGTLDETAAEVGGGGKGSR